MIDRTVTLSNNNATISNNNLIIAENQEKVYEAGMQTEYDRFWDSFQDYGNRSPNNYEFHGEGWNDETFTPKYDIVIATGRSTFQNNGVTDLAGALIKAGVKIDCSQSTGTFGYMFSESKTRTLPALEFLNADSLSYSFAYMYNLVEFEELKLNDNGTIIFNSTFVGNSNLEKLIFKGVIGQNGLNLQWSKKLTHESLMSIINALKDYSADTSGTEWKVTLGPTNIAKLTSEEQEIAREKGWILE